MATRNGFTPTKADVPFDPEIVAGNIQYLPLDKNELIQQGVMYVDPRFVQEVGRNTGKLTMPAYIFDENEDEEDWTGDVDGSTSKLPNTSQTSVIVSKFKAFEYNDLSLVIANGMTPNEALLNYIERFRNITMAKELKRVLKGMFEAEDIKDKLIFDISKESDPSISQDVFVDARAYFWEDQDEEPVYYIMHSATRATLKKKLKETTMVDFLQGAKIVTDDKLCDAGDGVHNTYVFRRNAIATSGDLAGSRSFIGRNELEKQGTEYIGYKRRYILMPTGVTFKGSLAKPTGANNTEIETGTNWGFVEMPDAHKYVRVGLIRSKESVTPPASGMEMASVKSTTSEKSNKG